MPRRFYQRPTLTVARDLLGLYLVRRIGRERLVGRIVEVEAYLGEKDPASHAYRGKTRRNEVMFREGGYLYVYFTYGMHFCCNVVTEADGKGRAVLLRAVEPVAGIRRMIQNRTGPKGHPPENREVLLEWLGSGPARLCQAFGIARAENGSDLRGASIWIARGTEAARPKSVARSQRIGITAGREKRWRFFLRGNKYVSGKTINL